MSRHLHTAFCEHFDPLKIRWWLFYVDGLPREGERYSHFDVLCTLIGGRSAEETEQLEHCFQRVYYGGARDSWHNWPCVCLRESTSAGEARGSMGGDGMSSIVAIIADLDRAADALPLPWTSTQFVFKALGRERMYADRLRFLSRGVVRQVDCDHEPIDLDTRRPRSRRLVEAWLAYELGWRDRRASCRWPRRPEVVIDLPVVGRDRAETSPGQLLIS